MTPKAHKFPALTLPYLPRTSDIVLRTHISVSHSSPQKKKAHHQAIGKENFDVIGLVGVLGGENRKTSYLVPRKSPNVEKSSVSHSEDVFSGPRVIPINFVGKFLPQVQIPTDHPCGDTIRWAAVMMLRNLHKAQPISARCVI